MEKNKAKAWLALIILGFIGLITAGTIAEFFTETIVRNKFSAEPYRADFFEEFESPDDWLPGRTTPSKVFATNSGSGDIIVRLKYEEQWTAANGKVLPNVLEYKDGKFVDENGEDYSDHVDMNLIPSPIPEGYKIEVALKLFSDLVCTEGDSRSVDNKTFTQNGITQGEDIENGVISAPATQDETTSQDEGADNQEDTDNNQENVTPEDIVRPDTVWMYDDSNSEGYYYYFEVLKKDEVTKNFLEAIQFNPVMDVHLVGLDQNGEYNESLYSDGKYNGFVEDGKYIFKYASDESSYANAQYKLSITMECLSAAKGAMENIWGYNKSFPDSCASSILYKKLSE